MQQFKTSHLIRQAEISAPALSLSLPLDEEPFLLTEEDVLPEVNVAEGIQFLASLEPRLDVYPATPTMTAVDAFEAVEAARKIVGDIGVVTYLRYRRRAERAMSGA
jgi:hypothetical protein